VHFRKIEDQWFLLDKEEDFLPGFYAGLVGIKKDEARELVDRPAGRLRTTTCSRARTIVLQRPVRWP